MKQLLYILIIPISLSIIIFISLRTLKLSVQELCDRDSCPRCFGEDMCEFIESGYISLQFNRISDICFNLISVKNVFFGRYHDKRVVLKKQLETNSNYYFIKNDLIEYLSADNNVLNNFKICNRVTAQTLFDQFKSVNPVNFEFALRFSVEPILLELFPSHSFPVPYLYGVCGRLMVVEYAGDTPLVNTVNYPWPARAYVAFQLLKAATAFTEAHNLFRLYLTDVSPDNIVVDEQFHIRFIDLDNAILSQKGLVRKENLHYSEHFEEDVFIFSENKICEADRSDHNIYSVCRLLLSKSAPWPMMNGGLLHNPPEDIVLNYPKLFQHIQECVCSTRHKDRFILSEQILQDLESILDNKF